jgi:transposase InsO family protein
VSEKAVSVNRISKLLGLGKATYYASSDPRERFLEKYEKTKGFVERVVRRHKCYGIRRIKTELEETHRVSVGRDTLAKLLRLWGLSMRRKMKTRKPSIIEKILVALADRTNLLKRTAITTVLQAVTTDMTALWYAGGKKRAYLSEHKDVFGQMVYGWALGERMSAELVRTSLKRALQCIKKLVGEIPKELIFHSDRGSQYTSYEYVDDVLTVGTLSYSQKGRPTDNAGQESRFGRFKDEWREEIGEIETFKELTRFMVKKMKYYNTKRRHTSIGNQTPLSFTAAQLALRTPGLKRHRKWFSFFRT